MLTNDIFLKPLELELQLLMINAKHSKLNMYHEL